MTNIGEHLAHVKPTGRHYHKGSFLVIAAQSSLVLKIGRKMFLVTSFTLLHIAQHGIDAEVSISGMSD